MAGEEQRTCFPHPPVPLPPFVDDGLPRVVNRNPRLADVGLELEKEEGKEWLANHEIIQLTRVDGCFVVLPRERDRTEDAELLQRTEQEMMRQLVEEHLDDLCAGHDLELFIKEGERYTRQESRQNAVWGTTMRSGPILTIWTTIHPYPTESRVRAITRTALSSASMALQSASFSGSRHRAPKPAGLPAFAGVNEHGSSPVAVEKTVTGERGTSYGGIGSGQHNPSCQLACVVDARLFAAGTSSHPSAPFTGRCTGDSPESQAAKGLLMAYGSPPKKQVARRNQTMFTAMLLTIGFVAALAVLMLGLGTLVAVTKGSFRDEEGNRWV